MQGLMKKTLVGAAVAATAFAAVAPANARDWHHGYRHHHHSNAGDVLAAGALGVAAGAVIGSVLAPPPAPVYVEPEPYPAYRTYYRPAPRVVYVSPEPWSRAWYEACSDRYRSFDPRSGTFVGYDGARHFCELN